MASSNLPSCYELRKNFPVCSSSEILLTTAARENTDEQHLIEKLLHPYITTKMSGELKNYWLSMKIFFRREFLLKQLKCVMRNAGCPHYACYISNNAHEHVTATLLYTNLTGLFCMSRTVVSMYVTKINENIYIFLLRRWERKVCLTFMIGLRECDCLPILRE